MTNIKKWYTLCIAAGCWKYMTRTSVRMTESEMKAYAPPGYFWYPNEQYIPVSRMVPHALGNTPDEVNKNYKLLITGKLQQQARLAA